MRPITLIPALLLVAPFIAVSATTANAQTATPAPAWVSTAELPLDAMNHIEKGDRLVAERKYGAARKQYRAAAAVLEGRGDFPVVPLRRIADSYYFEGMYQSAVRTLDRLARDAALNGDVVTQIWARWPMRPGFSVKTTSGSREAAPRWR